MSDILDKFCHRYQAQVGKSSRVWRRSRLSSYDVFAKDLQISPTIKYEDVPMVDISMPEDRFRALLEHDDWIKRAGLDGNYTRVENMIVEHEQECCLRAEHPTLQSAWEQYQVLLKMYQ